MKRLTVVLLAIFAVRSSTLGEDALDKDLLPSILHKAIEQHKALRCVNAQVTVTSILSDEYISSENIPPENKTVLKEFSSDYSGSKWRINVNAKRPSGEVAYSLVSAFDGERIYSYDHEGAMRVTTDQQWLDGWLHFSGVLFFPYSFFKPGDEVRNGLPTTLAAFNNVELGELLKNCKVEVVERGLQVAFRRENSSDQVLFGAKDHYYPVFFRRSGRDKGGEVEITFEVAELSQASPGTSTTAEILRFPKRGVLKIYRSGMLQRTDTIEVKSLKNSDCDDDTFTLDPSLATHVFDADSNTTIVLPK